MDKTRITLTVGQLRRLISEAKKTWPKTKPFFFHHAKLNGTHTCYNVPDKYGRLMDKVYDVIDVYDADNHKLYYIWTSKGKKTLESLERRFLGKWVTAEIAFQGWTNTRVRSVNFELAENPTKKEELTKKEEPETKKKPPEQMEFDLW